MKLESGPKKNKGDWSAWAKDFRADVKERGSEAVVDFLESHIQHVAGPLAGQYFEVQEWQKRDIIGPMFDALEPDGTRTYQVVTIGIPRKNGKSFLASALAIVGLLLEEGAQVVVGAKTRKQAGVVLDVARQMVYAEPELNEKIHVYAHSIVFESANSEIQAIGADGKNALGLNPSMAIMDEWAFYSDMGQEFYRAIQTAQGARAEPLFIEISTAASAGEGFGYQRWTYCRKVRDGIVEDDSHLVVLYEPEDGDDWKDPEVWKAVNPNYGISVQPRFLKREFIKAEQSTADAAAFRTFYCNQWVSSYQSWLDVDAWDRCAERPNIPDGARVFVGIDLGSTDDLTAMLTLAPRPDGTRHIECQFYCPEDKVNKARDGVNYRAWVDAGYITTTPGSVTDYDFVRRDLNALCDQYQVVEIGLDRWNATEFSIRCAEDDGLPMVGVGMGYASMSAPVISVERFVMDGRLAHGGNPVLRWMLANCVPEMDAAGNRKLTKAKSTGKIDGIIALLIATNRADANAFEDKSDAYRVRAL